MSSPSQESLGNENAVEAPICPACGEAGERWYQTSLPGGPWMWHCGQCGSGFASPMPEPYALATMYDEGYTSSEESAVKSRRLAPVYFRMIAPLLPAGAFRFLEIGGSHGDLCVEVARQTNADVTLLEPGASAVRAAIARGVRAVRGYAGAYEDPEGFDVIFAAHVIEHVPNPRAFADECRKLLKPGGRLILLTPNARAWKLRWFREKATWAAPTEHTFLLTSAGARALFTREGFSVQAASHIPNWRQYPYFLTRQLSRLLTRVIGRSDRGTAPAGGATSLPVIDAPAPTTARQDWRLYLRRSGRVILWAEYALLALIDTLAGESRRDELLVIVRRSAEVIT